MRKDIENIGTAKNLNELRDCIELAMHELGEKAEWSGWDDGNIYISKNGRTLAVIKQPKFTEGEA